MNLYGICSTSPEPRVLCDCLFPFFSQVETERRNCAVYGYEIQARDEAGRLRLRIPYFWSERWEKWFYVILPGERK